MSGTIFSILLELRAGIRYTGETEEDNMMVDPFGSTVSSSSAWAVQPSRENERAEAVPDNEAVEAEARTAKAPLQSYQGTNIDVQA
jgi:hypothetical protein